MTNNMDVLDVYRPVSPTFAPGECGSQESSGISTTMQPGTTWSAQTAKYVLQATHRLLARRDFLMLTVSQRILSPFVRDDENRLIGRSIVRTTLKACAVWGFILAVEIVLTLLSS
jgi:hypothetical protein